MTHARRPPDRARANRRKHGISPDHHDDPRGDRRLRQRGRRAGPLPRGRRPDGRPDRGAPDAGRQVAGRDPGSGPSTGSTRLRRFLTLLGDPHRAYPIVHVGGTSGKGSTAAAIAAILSAAGYRTGLHTSPYLQAATEKLQVGDRLIAPETFAGLVDEILEAAERFAAGGEERLTYGEVWVALLALHFARERVDLAVIEVGAGGRFDLTNVVTPGGQRRHLGRAGSHRHPRRDHPRDRLAQGRDHQDRAPRRSRR